MSKFSKWAAGTSFGLVATALAVFYSAVPAQASIVFTYNCTVTSATTCPTGGGPFGTVTLTDSVVDPNRVDINVALNSANILAQDSFYTGLNNFYLNYNGPTPSNTSFVMVLQSDAAGSHSNDGGDASLNSNSEGPDSTTLDMLLNPAGSASSSTFSASLVLFSNLSGHAETNLDASMFDLIDANNLLYSAFDTLPSDHTFKGGSTLAPVITTLVTGVPEPATLSIFGAGLMTIGFAMWRRRRPKAT
jgi:PEP-CTERM motif